MATDWYVYELIDPRDGSVFYVGKGCGDRLNDHVRETIAGRVSNQAKTDRIRSILNASLSVITKVVSRHDDEAEALDIEAELIGSIHGLTNIQPRGCFSSSMKSNTRIVIERIRTLALMDATSYREDLSLFGMEYLEVVDMLEEAFIRVWPNKSQEMAV